MTPFPSYAGIQKLAHQGGQELPAAASEQQELQGLSVMSKPAKCQCRELTQSEEHGAQQYFFSHKHRVSEGAGAGLPGIGNA